MPFKSNQNFTTVNKKLDKVVKDIDGRLIERGLYVAATVGAGYAATITPIDTSNLINSQYISPARPTVTGQYVSVGYTANYALYVHESSGKLKGKPRSSVESFTTKSGSVAFASNEGNFWDPDAEPQFLLKGFQEHMSEVNDAFFKAVKL